MATGQSDVILRHIRKLAAGQTAATLSDRELLSRFAHCQDESAFEALVGRHGPMVLRLCQRVLHNWHDAEDVFQATFLVLAREAPSRRWRESVANWLYEVAYHLALNARTAAARRCDREVPARPRSAADPLTEITGRELLAVLDEELARLPEKLRAPLVLCCLEGHTRDEAAQRLGCSLGTLKSRLEHGRERLRKFLARRGLTLSAALFASLLTESISPAAAPMALLRGTVQAALTVAGAKGPAGAISASAAVLAQTWLRTLFMSKVKLAVVVLLGLGAALAGTGLLAYQTLAPGQNQPTADGGQKAKNPDEPKGAKPSQARTDLYGDPLPAGAIARLGTVRLRLYGGRSVGFSSDGKAVWACNGLTISWFNGESGKKIRDIRLPQAENSYSYVLSGDGKTLALNEGNSIGVWNIVTGKALARIPFNDKDGLSVPLALSADGKLLAARNNEEASVRLWEVDTGRELRRFGMASGQPRVRDWRSVFYCNVAFSPDGTKLMSGNDYGMIQMWEVLTGKEVYRKELGRYDTHPRMAFSPDGKVVAVGGPGEIIYLFDAVEGKELHRMKGVNADVHCLTFSPDSKTVASGEWDGTIRFWDVASGKEIRRTPETVSMVSALAFSADGKKLAAIIAESTLLFDVATGRESPSFGSDLTSVASFVFYPDGKSLVSQGRSQKIRFWDTSSGKELGAIQSDFLVEAYSPDCKVLAAQTMNLNKKSMIHLLQARNGKEIRRLPLPDNIWTDCIAFSSDGKTVACASSDDMLRLWDSTTGREIRRFHLHSKEQGEYRIFKQFSQDAKKLAIGYHNRNSFWAHIWDVETGKEYPSFKITGADFPFGAFRFSPDGNTLGIWMERAAKKSKNDQAAEVIFLWEVATGKERLRFNGPPCDECPAMAFAPGGRFLALCGHDAIIRFWDCASGEEFYRLQSPQFFVYSMGFSSDGKMLATGGADTTILVWDMADVTKNSLKRRPHQISEEGMQGCWKDLAGEDAAQAYQAINRIADNPEIAVPFLRAHLQPAAPQVKEPMAKWIEELDSQHFAVREEATKKLEQLGEMAGLSLETALRNNPSLEARRRIDGLLAKLSRRISLGPQELRAARLIEVLELIGTPAAEEALRGLAQGAPEARLTWQAKAALERLERHFATTP